MKVRAQRTHYMGASNRNEEAFNNNTNLKTQSVFERSFNKSKSLFAQSQPDIIEGTGKPNTNSRVNPFLGTHNELETQRFDKQNFKHYKYTKMNFPIGRKTITFAPLLNSDVRAIQQQFKDKKINMHKLQELKQAFVKNNRDRRNLQSYFEQYAKNGSIDSKGLQKMVKEYGFDVNQDEAKLIFRLTHKSNKSNDMSEELGMDGFVELMTKDDVYYKTMLLGQNRASQEYTFQANFTQKVHEVLRNKFPRLKQAFKIYRQRNEEVGLKQFEYVMKKLDLTDLVLTKDQRDNIYKKYSDENGSFNVEGLICAIAEQQHQNRESKSIFRPNDFIEDLKANKQIQFSRSLRNRHFGMKTLSNLEYENQFSKARTIIDQLKKLKIKRKNAKQNEDIFNQNANREAISQQQVILNAEKILKKQGINFHKEDYEAFAAYFNYDVHGNISLKKLNEEVFHESQKDARDRIERRVRNEAPKNHNQSSLFDSDRNAAIHTISKIKAQKMNPQTRQLFRFLDEDKDGYINADQFKQKISSLNIVEGWEIENLANHLKINEQGSINFKDFSKGINQDLRQIQKQLPLVRSRNSKSCYDWSQTTKMKNSQIKMQNQTEYQRPTKFSAWPHNITHQDLSLLQAPPMAGTYASESQRFTDKKQEYGMKQKMMAMAVAENRRQKIAEWNSKLQQRAENNREKQQQRMAAKNYALRLTKQKYQLNCHQ